MSKLMFPKFLARTFVTVNAQARGEDGVEKILLYAGHAILDEKSRNVMTADRQLVKLNGLVIFEGDISPGQDIKGYITFNGMERTISGISRPRNPDGTVFSTEIGFE